MDKQPRDYQSAGVDAVYLHLRTKETNPCVVIPTGGGKSLMMGIICNDVVRKWNGRVILLAHVQELLEQSFAEMKEIDPTLPIGIYSAGLKQRNASEPITIAGIQSAYRNQEDFIPPDIIMVDEAHRIPEDGEGMYLAFIRAMQEKNPRVRVIGFTATPYRLSSGPICAATNILNEICFEATIRELIAKGFICPVIAYGGGGEEDYSQVSLRGGEFVQGELEALMNDDAKVASAVIELAGRVKEQGRKSTLVFASGVDHGKKVANFLKECTGDAVGQVYGETPKLERAEMIRRFRSGELKWLVNCDVLTLGFNAPNVDAIGILRATMSPGLFYQMCGRGFRLHPSKKDCLIVDFGGNVLRHGPIDAIDPDAVQKSKGTGEAPAKKCPQCLRYVPTGCLTCETCGFAFPPREEARHEAESYRGKGILSGEPEDIDVVDVFYYHHVGRDSGIPSIRVSYDVGFMVYNEYVCIEHGGFARSKAEQWWNRRTGQPAIPDGMTVDKALEYLLTTQDPIAKPKKIRVKQDGKYPEIVGFQF